MAPLSISEDERTPLCNIFKLNILHPNLVRLAEWLFAKKSSCQEKEWRAGVRAPGHTQEYIWEKQGETNPFSATLPAARRSDWRGTHL